METAALTRGSIPPQLVSLALPLIFGNILQQLYNTIDAMVIGRFAGETAFAAIGVAGTVMNLFLFLLSGCCTGISVLFAQQYGSRDLAGFRQEGFLASVFGGLFTLVLSLAALLLLAPRALSMLDQWRTLPTFNAKRRRDFTRAEYDKMKSAGQIPYSRSGRGKLSP